jgi:hypothetical protein
MQTRSINKTEQQKQIEQKVIDAVKEQRARLKEITDFLPLDRSTDQ